MAVTVRNEALPVTPGRVDIRIKSVTPSRCGTMNAEERLKELNIVLPQVAGPVASYAPAVLSGPYVFVSGQLPTVEGKLGNARG